MARDDYPVVVYQVLSYLYVCLKNGEKADPKMIQNDGPFFRINYSYWAYIMDNLQKSGKIRGITIARAAGKERIILDLEDCEITPEGIEYLCDNSFLSKAKSFLKDAKGIIPFV